MTERESSASDAGQARIVGNLAGVVEWANDAFARLSGIALDETVDKPVGRLLERAGIDLEVVEFVAQHFFEGRLCRVAFPFERPDGRRIDVLLEVEALRDPLGEIDRFSAIAREEGPAAANAAIVPVTRAPATTDRRPRTPAAAGATLDLAPAIRRAVARTRAAWKGGPGGTTQDPDRSVALELDLEPVDGAIDVTISGMGDETFGRAFDAPYGGADDQALDGPLDEEAASASVAGIVEALLEAARLGVEETGNAGGFVTLSTAWLPPQRRFVSRVHPIAACPAERGEIGDVVLEVHDTGRALPVPVVAAFRRGDLVEAGTILPSSRTRALVEACRRARALGARIHLDSTPGCGTQLLVLFAPDQAR
ncbi:MAG: PAS domain-containing protein [Myxococcota bacterium]